MFEHVGSLASDVRDQETLRLRVVMLDLSMASAHSIAAEHYQIGSDVVSRMLHDMVQ